MNNAKRTYLVCAGLVVLFAVIALVGLFGHKINEDKKAEASSSSTKPVLAAGTWNFHAGKFQSQALVSDNVVSVTFGSKDSQLLYWKGTFDKSSLKNGDKIVSKPKKKAMANSLGASDAKSLTFTYNDGKLTYDFAMMGESKPVHLEK